MAGRLGTSPVEKHELLAALVPDVVLQVNNKVLSRGDLATRTALKKANGDRVVGERARVLAALAAVDAVAIFDEPTPLELILATRPDVLVKGGRARSGVMEQPGEDCPDSGGIFDHAADREGSGK